MNNEIRRAVEIIDQRIEVLRDIRNKLTEEFGNASSHHSTRKVEARAKQSSNRDASNGASSNGSTRKMELVKFLVAHGPSKRAKINAESGIPVGTVANLLNGNDFVRRSDGTWDVRQSPVEKGIQ